MFGFEYIAAGYFHLASADARCRQDRKPVVNVEIEKEDVVYDTSKSHKELKERRNEMITVFGPNVEVHNYGQFENRYEMTTKYTLGTDRNPALNYACVYFHTVDVKLTFKPTIYISSALEKGSCMYNVALKHEEEHLRIEKEAIAKHKQYIADSIYSTLRGLNDTYDIVSIGMIPQEQERLKKYLAKLTKNVWGKRREEALAEHRKIDTLESYRHAAGECRAGGT